MSECEINAAFEKKLQQLKVQEELIVKLLKNIQSQLKKYEVEELHTCNELISDKSEEEESDSENGTTDPDLLVKILDCAELVNEKNSLNLELNNILGCNSTKESEESESEESD